jgi:hypothetical protein
MTSRCVSVSCLLALVIGLPALAGPTAEARVVRLAVTSRGPFAGGMAFGATGPYEKLVGTAFMEVDPRDPHNAGLVNLDRAPRNARGLVEYATDVYILKPADMTRGNRKIFLEVHNRGNKLALNFLNDAPAGVNDPTTPAHAGNGFLFREGYTVVWTGWQGDVTPGNSRMTIRVPVATQPDGSPIVAAVRQEYSDRFIPIGGTLTLPLSGSPQFASYESATLDTRQASLTVREWSDAPRAPIAPDRWAFATCRRNPDGSLALTPSRFDICLFAGFEVANLYEIVYPARHPLVMGLGYAATRDVVSFLRYEMRDDTGAANPLAPGASEPGIKEAYGLGISSSGMYMRDWLYLGFNEDERGRQVFGGAWSHIGGAHRLLANVEFAQPNDYSRQDIWHDYLSASIFPFGYGITTDPVTGRTDGILKRPGSDPKLLVTDTSTEWWQFQGSLVSHDATGEPVPLPENTRHYLFSSYQHSVGPPASPPAQGTCQQLSNPLSGGLLARALLVVLDEWVTQGKRPPKNRIPQGGDLVEPDQSSTEFPAIPGVTYTGLVNELQVWDYGPGFGPQGGRLTLLPPVPVPGTGYRVLVPRVDRDGHDVAGIRQPDVEAPLATYTGWNVRRAGFREGEMCGLTGSSIPLPVTKAERKASGDPRKSLEERYGTHDKYVKQVEKAARKLVKERFLLQEDYERIVEQAGTSDVLR